MPLPVIDSNSSAVASVSDRSSAARTTAAASGCSLPRSRLAASLQDLLLGPSPPPPARPARAGLPSVMVPVLSITSVSTFSIASRASASRISTPADAPRPVATMIDIGVASPSAHGQAMISTATALTIAWANWGGGPISAQATNVTTATTTTAGTKYPATVSATRWIGARLRCASATICTIRASSVSAPTCSARITKLPVALIVPPITLSPGCFSTGIGSPVTIDSSTLLRPSTTTPSTGTFSPGRTRSESPGCTWASGMSSSRPSSRMIRAVAGASSSSERIADAVRPRARSSSTCPSSTSVVMTAAASK